MSDQFKALILDQKGEEFTREVKSIDKNFLKHGDVTIKVDYSDLNFKDGMILKNGGRLVKEFPHIPGIDFSGQVLDSENSNFKEGDEVHGTLDWSDFVLSDGFDGNGLPLSRCSPQFNLSTNMITLGMTGLCAFIGLFEIGRPLPGDTVAVSAAAGGVGSIAIQLAKIAGCKTIGIAGGSKKTTSLREKLGVEIALNYKWINKKNVKDAINFYGNCIYSNYLRDLI
mgnify:CR=1 FL=1